LSLTLACGGDDSGAEAGVGGNRDGCGEPGSHSYEVSEHSCACEDGYAWCSPALDEFDCCAIDDGESSDTGEPLAEPDSPCDETRIEQLACVVDPALPDPTGSTVWACNGERWIEVPNYSTFACMAEGYPFAYGCVPGDPDPSFVCGFGQGSSCDPSDFAGVCQDEDIIDTCVWGRRTIDRCSRLCAELGAYGEGFSGGACTQPEPDSPATCECCTSC
jgi:hypothetical protein